MQTIDAKNRTDGSMFGSKSPRAIRSIMQESSVPFTVIPNAKIPELSETRREDREESIQMLLKRPKHKITGRDEANMS